MSVGSSENKFTCCTICLNDYEKGDMVKEIPNCGHIFHSECLNEWLLRRFKCPNCNLTIKSEILGIKTNENRNNSDAIGSPLTFIGVYGEDNNAGEVAQEEALERNEFLS